MTEQQKEALDKLHEALYLAVMTGLMNHIEEKTGKRVTQEFDRAITQLRDS